MAGDFDEDLHKRDEGGRFASIGAASAKKETEALARYRKAKFEGIQRRLKDDRAKLEEMAKTGKPHTFKLKQGGSVLVSKDPSKPGQWRATFLEDDGTPTGHVEAKTALEALERAKGSGADLGGKPPLKVKEASAGDFHKAFSAAFKDSKFKAHVSHYSEEELGKMLRITSTDGKAGVAVKDHGDGRIEATALFNAGGSKGAGLELLNHVIETAGVNYVECYGPVLNQLYEKLGFEVESSSAFNPEYASADWSVEEFDHPNYFTMRLKG